MILWSSCCSCSSWSSNITTIVGVSATATHVLPSIKEEEERRPFNHFKTGAVRIRRSSSTTTTSRVATTSSNSNGNSTSSSSSSSVTCPVVDTVADFDIEQYAARPWYSHQQAVNFYLPQRLNYCVRADYNVRDRPTFPWGYTVDVRNQAQDKDGKLQGGNLCAYQTDLESGQQPGKLAVAPCFLPKMFAGPYWVLLYNEEKGYALISGGQPSTPSYDDKDGNFIGCRTGKGINDAGLWIFSRSPVRDQEMIDFVRGMAVEMGIDVTVLNDVNHEGCTYNDIDDDDDDDGAGAGAGNDENLAPTPVPSSYTSIVPTTEQDQEEEDNGDNEGDQQCMDSTEPFKLWFDIFGAEKDCDWVKEKSWWRCIFYSNLCPKTCGNCNGD
jgi:Bacterial lipocalin